MRRAVICPAILLLVAATVASNRVSDAAEPVTSSAAGANAAPAQLDAVAARLSFRGDAAEIVWLGEGNAKALALFQPPGRTPVNGAVVLMLGPNESIGDRQLTLPARRALSAGGWAVLAVHGQPLGKRDLGAFDAARSRVKFKGAHAYLSADGYSRIVVVANGRVAEAVWPEIQAGRLAVIGFVALGLWNSADFAPPIPVFDIVNAGDEAALELSKERLATSHLNAGQPIERFAFPATSGGYRSQGSLIAGRMRGWLARQFVEP